MDGVYILVVDDESRMRKLLKDFLSQKGYQILEAEDGEKAIEVFEENRNKIKLILLDVMMPKLDGWSVLRKIRQESNLPVIMLTAKIEDNDKIKGLTIGADDYITKPFNPLELVARVKSQFRRCTLYNEQQNEKDVIEINGLVIDKDEHKCLLYDKEIELTPIEFDILLYLANNRGKVISTEELFEKVWKEKYFDSNNTVMVHIRRIREKLGEDTKKPKFIKTVWGVGYKLE